MQKILSFKVSSEMYCFDVMSVISIDQQTPVTEIPLSEKHVIGVINLRGQIIPVIDFRKLFNIPPLTSNRESCFVFIETEAGRLGCVVDSVSDVIELDENSKKSGSEVLSTQSTQYIEQILKIKEQVYFLLNPIKLYDSINNNNLQNNLTNKVG